MSMALQTLLRRLRSKAPSLTQRISGGCAEGACQLWSSELKLTQQALMQNGYGSCLPQIYHASNLRSQRGYSSMTSVEDRDNGSSQLDSPSIVEANNNSSNEPAADGIRLGPKISERHNLAMIFTCTVCQTRSAKTMSRQTYENGVVIVRCGGCKNLHLIADHKGWFGEPGTVEDFLRHKGVEVRKGSEESYEFTIEDLAGWSPPVKE